MIFLPNQDPAINSGKDILIGGITLSHVVRGDESKATIGYWLVENCAGRGYMTETVNLVCDFAFNTLGLVRIEATSMPTNAASARVLDKCGFIQEGYARKILEINGRMTDHLLWGRMKPNMTSPAGKPATSPT